MDNIWYKVVLLGLLLMFIIAPFAGFAPLLLVLLIASVYWFFAPIIQTLIFGKEKEID